MDLFSALSGNPFYCDCHLAWLSSWIKNDYVESGKNKIHITTFEIIFLNKNHFE